MTVIYRFPDDKNDKKDAKDKKWIYRDKKGNIVRDAQTLAYVASLVIPPAYRDVEIYYTKRPKILYMGVDEAGRSQFHYASWWSDQQREIKLCRLIHFGEQLPRIMSDINRFLSSGGTEKDKRWTANRVIALILRIISHCYFRVGNVKYERLYESHGISTITRKHVRISDAGMTIRFIGKKGVENECTVHDPVAIRAMRDLIAAHDQKDPHLFKYQSGGEWHHVRHTDINDFLKQYHPSFTSKMFRTFDTNIMLIKILAKTEPDKLTAGQRKRALVAALREVSAAVHNTVAICRKDYADPSMLKLYLEHPRKYRKWFITPTTAERIRFINWLKSRCPESASIEDTGSDDED